MLVVLLKDSLYIDEEYYLVFKNSELRFWMVALIFLMVLIILIIDFRFKIRLIFLFVVLYYIIILNNLVSFFLLYEIIFVLIIFAIILLGYSFERLIAGFLIIFYSFLFSSPILIILLLFDHRFLIKEWLIYSNLMNYFFVGSFIVKFPIFGFHYWLPVAHVEASTVGSMVLAGILLKVGCLGLIYVVIYINFIIKFHWLAFGVIIVILIILRLRDLKLIIAYSSVAHIRMVFYVIIWGFNVGKKGCIFMIFYHGFISPLIFWVVGILAWWKTRSLLVIKMIAFSYIFVLCLFVLLIINISFPPFIGFIREILIFKAVINSKLIVYILIIGVLFRCYYNIYLFWCFNGFIGLVYKINFFSIDLFIFIMIVIFLNLYWISRMYDILWLCKFFNSGYIYCKDFFVFNYNSFNNFFVGESKGFYF